MFKPQTVPAPKITFIFPLIEQNHFLHKLVASFIYKPLSMKVSKMVCLPTPLHTWNHHLFFILKKQNFVRTCQTTLLQATFFSIIYKQLSAPAGTGSGDILAQSKIQTYWGQANGAGCNWNTNLRGEVQQILVLSKICRTRLEGHSNNLQGQTAVVTKPKGNQKPVWYQ